MWFKKNNLPITSSKQYLEQHQWSPKTAINFLNDCPDVTSEDLLFLYQKLLIKISEMSNLSAKWVYLTDVYKASLISGRDLIKSIRSNNRNRKIHYYNEDSGKMPSVKINAFPWTKFFKAYTVSNPNGLYHYDNDIPDPISCSRLKFSQAHTNNLVNLFKHCIFDHNFIYIKEQLQRYSLPQYVSLLIEHQPLDETWKDCTLAYITSLKKSANSSYYMFKNHGLDDDAMSEISDKAGSLNSTIKGIYKVQQDYTEKYCNAVKNHQSNQDNDSASTSDTSKEKSQAKEDSKSKQTNKKLAKSNQNKPTDSQKAMKDAKKAIEGTLLSQVCNLLQELPKSDNSNILTELLPIYIKSLHEENAMPFNKILVFTINKLKGVKDKSDNSLMFAKTLEL